MSNVFAKGKIALAICDRSGFAYPYREMVKEPGTGLLVHWTESDGPYNIVDHPQNYPPKDLVDAVALRWARPDRDEHANNDFLLADNDGKILVFGDILETQIYVPASIVSGVTAASPWRD